MTFRDRYFDMLGPPTYHDWQEVEAAAPGAKL
jgi:hypothetical protein